MPAPYCYEHPRPQVTVDLVAFALLEHALRVLLVRRGRDPFAGKWAIPGGFLNLDEPAEEAARRELREETGLELRGPVEPIGFFADPGRDPRGRTISLAFAAVVRPGEDAVRGGDDAAEAAWHDVAAPVDLAFDHAQILRAAAAWLRDGLSEDSMGLAMLPESFEVDLVHILFESLGHSRRRSRAWLRGLERKGRVRYVDGERALYRIEAPAR